MSSNTIAHVCRSCQKGRSYQQRRPQRPSYVEDYYPKYNRQTRKERPSYNQNGNGYSNSNNTADFNQHVCRSCGKH